MAAVTAFLVALQFIVSFAELLNVEMPPECIEKDYCTERGDQYPDNVMKTLEPEMTKLVLNIDHNIVRRRSGECFNECAIKTQNSTVYYIRDEDDRVRVVVQIKDVFEQVFDETECLNPGPITYDTNHLGRRQADDFQLYCESVLRQDEFFVLSNDLSTLERVKIKSGLPVCCICKYDNSIYRL